MSIATDLRNLGKRSWIELLQYVAVSLLIIGCIGGLFYAGMTWDFFSRWGMFTIFTGVLSWMFLSRSLPIVRKTKFQILLGTALTIHCLLWFFILRHTNPWKVIWFKVVMPIEFVALLACTSRLEQRHHITYRGK